MTDVSDSFPSDGSLDGAQGWTNYNSTGWTVSSGVAYGPTSASAIGFLIYQTSVGSPNQWIKVDLTSLSGSIYTGIVLRSDNTGTGEYYNLFLRASDNVYISKCTGTTQDTDLYGPTSWTVTDTDVIGLSVTGTGESTVFYLYKNPVGANPAAWDDGANYDNRDSHTMTGQSAYVVDTGNYIGLLSTTNAVSFDNFSGGALPAAGAIHRYRLKVG